MRTTDTGHNVPTPFQPTALACRPSHTKLLSSQPPPPTHFQPLNKYASSCDTLKNRTKVIAKHELDVDVVRPSREPPPTSEYCVGLLSASSPFTTRQVACKPHVLAGCTTSPPTASSRCTSLQNQFRTTFLEEPGSITAIWQGTKRRLEGFLVSWLVDSLIA